MKSSLSRLRPAILVLLGASAAYAAWAIYSSDTSSSPGSLRRTNAVRRPNRRARLPTGPEAIYRLFEQPDISLGEANVFGTRLVLDAYNIISEDAARQLAANSDHELSPEDVERQLMEFYDDVVGRLLGHAQRPLTLVETNLVSLFILGRIPHDGLRLALQRHQQTFYDRASEVGVVNDGAESFVPTEASWPSDEDTEGGVLDTAGQSLQRTLYHIAEERAR
jgi:hypothetical protein